MSSMSSLKLAKDVNVIEGKGDFIGGETTGLVERLESGDVVKSPWTGRPDEIVCKQEMAIEAQIYKRLGSHPRLLEFKQWDRVQYTLTLENMPHGNLKGYVKSFGHDISLVQRQQWALEAAEGIELIHAHGIVQSDVGPHNFLLDEKLGLKICDFGGSSLDGTRALVASGVRYTLPGTGDNQIATVQHDLFALGSTIYFIIVGNDPYNERNDEGEIARLFEEGKFPTLDGLAFAEVIKMCWRQEAKSASTVVELIRQSMQSNNSSPVDY